MADVPNHACAAMHLGLWMVEPEWFGTALRLVRQGLYPYCEHNIRTLERQYLYCRYVPRLDAEQRPSAQPPPVESDAASERARFQRVGRTAIIQISGAMTKGRSKFSGTSSLDVRRQVRSAASDSTIDAIMLHVDSPGGTVAGTADLADDVARAAASKPLAAHIDDLGASAAYWIASQAATVSASKTSEIGSIGTVLVVEDSSEQASAEGVKVHVISTGAFKGIGVPGAEVTDEQLAHLRDRVESLNDHFVSGVARGRKMSRGRLSESADGRVFVAEDAVGRGLIDKVSSFDDAFRSVSREGERARRAGDRAARERRASVKLMGAKMESVRSVS